MHPLCKILNTPVMSICLVKQSDGTWVEKHQRFLFNVYKLYFIFVTFFYVFNVFNFFLERFFLHLWRTGRLAPRSLTCECIKLSRVFLLHGRNIIPSFESHQLSKIPRLTPSTGMLKSCCRGLENLRGFYQYRCLFVENGMTQIYY